MGKYSEGYAVVTLSLIIEVLGRKQTCDHTQGIVWTAPIIGTDLADSQEYRSDIYNKSFEESVHINTLAPLNRAPLLHILLR